MDSGMQDKIYKSSNFYLTLGFIDGKFMIWLDKNDIIFYQL